MFLITSKGFGNLNFSRIIEDLLLNLLGFITKFINFLEISLQIIIKSVENENGNLSFDRDDVLKLVEHTTGVELLTSLKEAKTSTTAPTLCWLITWYIFSHLISFS